MFMISKETKIYIVAPIAYFNGGAELLHQLCSMLNKKRIGSIAVMCYWDKKESVFIDVVVPDHIKRYCTSYTKIIDDSENNLIIVPEQYTQPLKRYKSIQKCVWWLGMNQYFWWSEMSAHPFLKLAYHWGRYLVGRDTPLRPSELKASNISHLAQCWYGVSYLHTKGFHNVGYLSDYIYSKYDDCVAGERDIIVLYNPKRNIKFLKKIKILGQAPTYG